jgi:hypothetical protein
MFNARANRENERQLISPPSLRRVWISIESFPNVLKQHLLPAAIIEFSSAAVSVTSDPLGYLQGSSVLQAIRDAGSPERAGGIIRRRGRHLSIVASGDSLHQTWSLLGRVSAPSRTRL